MGLPHLLAGALVLTGLSTLSTIATVVVQVASGKLTVVQGVASVLMSAAGFAGVGVMAKLGMASLTLQHAKLASVVAQLQAFSMAGWTVQNYWANQRRR